MHCARATRVLVVSFGEKKLENEVDALENIIARLNGE
jgi:hypothetical protein